MKQDGWSQWMKTNPLEICPDMPALLIQPWSKEKNEAEKERFLSKKRKEGPTPPAQPQGGRPHPFNNRHLPYNRHQLDANLAWLDTMEDEPDHQQGTTGGTASTMENTMDSGVASQETGVVSDGDDPRSVQSGGQTGDSGEQQTAGATSPDS